ncbi:hypothetical protein [Clostridium perfringens]|uniref:hypothetical protein n=1 Tax=Clostridium perfringens TaxID=1502 RepID=UPI0008A70302|nr:hypothetical protein [Clostridium perfringens]AOY53846.1 hypothetical protein FORC25_1431 [Clostridium perfringens]MDK0856941.1 hypothetical protein [Clostridium perfringens]MDM0730224.1 hypothetical protein [Clostridium perfringens]
MSKLVLKIKGLLGFCQCAECWHRSTLIVESKEANVKRHICEDCFEKLMALLSYTKIEEE